MKSSSGNLWFFEAAMGSHLLVLFHLFFGSVIAPSVYVTSPVLVQLLGTEQVVRWMTEVA